MKKPNMLEVYRELHKHMDRSGFRPLIQAASKLFNAPVVFTDNTYHLVSLYPASPIGDFVFDALLETGGLDDETISAFTSVYLHTPGNTYEPFFEKDGLVKDCPRIFAEVYDEDHILGHVAIFLKDVQFESWQLEVASILTDILRIKINLTQQKPSVQSDSLNYLLDPNLSQQAKMRIISQLSQLNEKKGILLVAPLNQTKAQHAFASVAMNYLTHAFPNAIPTVYQNNLVVLLVEDPLKGNLKSQAESVSIYLSQYYILSGAVDVAGDLLNLSDAFIKARLSGLFRYVLESRSKEHPSGLIYYGEIAPEPLFLYLSQLKEVGSLLHPVLEEIIYYDELNATEYFVTLRAYCRHLFSKNATSEELHLHRNTLNYRLSRIEELFKIDLQDYHEVLYLAISMEISKFTH